MNHEQVLETQPPGSAAAARPEAADGGDIHTAWNAFQLWTGSRNAELFRRSYLGHYTDREHFGHWLLQDFGADQRLRQLPEWLQNYVRLDGAGFATGFEQQGAYHIYDAPNGGGSYIFDAYCLIRSDSS